MLQRSGSPTPATPWVVGIASLGVLGAMAVVACITAPPPDLAAGPPHRLTILHDSVVPPADEILATLPSEFVVPVQIDDPTLPVVFNVFVDFGVDGTGNDRPTYSKTMNPPFLVDGGVSLLPFILDPNAFDMRFCHRIEFVVAHGFVLPTLHTPDPVLDPAGGDSVTWFFNGGGGPNGCPVYDAGAFQDGAFRDVTPDRLLVTGGDR